MRAEDAIEADWLKTYKAQRNILWNELVNLNTYLFLAEKIQAFPFHLFMPFREQSTFWRAAEEAFFEASIMIIWRISLDTHKDVLTLSKFKNNMRAHMRDKNLGAVLDRKSRDVNKRLEKFSAELKLARDNYFAHLNKQKHLYPDGQERRSNALRLQDLKQLLDMLRELFDALCFGERHALWVLEYHERNREHGNLDIDYLLDCVVKNSQLLNMPERNQDAWSKKRSSLSSEELDILNFYRRKFQMPPV